MTIWRGPISVQRIGCSVMGTDGGFQQVVCLAIDSNGVQLSCVSQRPEHVAAAQSINSTSDITFNVFTGFDDCFDLLVNNDSTNL